jgi:hypothetical protein
MARDDEPIDDSPSLKSSANREPVLKSMQVSIKDTFSDRVRHASPQEKGLNFKKLKSHFEKVTD